ncbi:MAG: DNA-formamidopyrimidine glycosylase family protein [Opitutus sp.]
MPELPDIEVYIDALTKRVLGRRLEQVRVEDLFILRAARPPIDSLVGRHVTAFRRIGKRIAFGFEQDRWLVLHLMVAGRLQWADTGASLAAKNMLATLRFETGTLAITEAGKKRRASLHVVDGTQGLSEHDPGGLEVLTCSEREFAAALTSSNHTLKRALTDPHLFSGIGNSFSDEILHRARLSPVALTQKLSPEEIGHLFRTGAVVLREWTERLLEEAVEKFPAKVTAFRPEMAVHGKFGKPCPVCGALVQRIVYAENEVNYCPDCQTGGRILADRSLSRLLKEDWPRSEEEAEALRRRVQG